MKIFFAFVSLVAFCSTATAQDIKTAEDLFKLKQYDKAKIAIDKAIDGSYKDDPKAWIWKHKIYFQAGTAAKPADATTILFTGFESLKKAMSMPKGEEAAILMLGVDYLSGYNNYYVTFINNGSTLMNSNDYDGALENFKKGIAISTFFYEKKMITTALDTMLNFYAGYTAMKALKDNEAVYYFKKLADAGAYGTDLQIAYGWLSNYYTDKKDLANARAVSEKGLKLYPNDEYLKSIKIKLDRESGDVAALFKNYEDIIAGGKAEFSDYLGYGAELYDHLYVDVKETADRAAKEKRMLEVLNKAYTLRNNSAETNYILGMYYTSKALELDKESKKSTITEAEKESLKKEINANAAKSASYLEATTDLYSKKPSLKPNDKEHYKNALQQLVNLYKYTANKTKLAAAEEKLKGL